MKIQKISQLLLLFVTAILIFYSCTQETTESDTTTPKIENTLKSVSLFNDSTSTDPAILLTSLKKLNQAIDSIGYPDAGYKIWQVASQDSVGFTFMVEGYWPDQKTYDIIHEHELYKKTSETELSAFEGLKNTWYYRFNKVK